MEPVENEELETGEKGLLSQLKDNIRIRSALGILIAILGAILVNYILSAITVEHGSASNNPLIVRTPLTFVLSLSENCP